MQGNEYVITTVSFRFLVQVVFGLHFVQLFSLLVRVHLLERLVGLETQ